ncbi:hypothetical protein IU451_28925 [Nocardia cyriacigeorgica]|uniref:hypothetical protein n=1 Tax=Nocardia cyriacigeorgica TaxID=135487 RepID=UPI001894AEE8|nr:hypothetical protein [Nocardia cyriacigeorgica]MBF6326527.1 hypothetical protein [Nocardia cyriacigeorgica]
MSLVDRGCDRPAAYCDGCGERIFAYGDEVVLAYVLDEHARPVLDNPRHYHRYCVATRRPSEV